MKLDPDKQFKVSDSSVIAILKNYGFELYGYKLATSGIENTTLLINAKPHNLVIRIYRLDKKPLNEIDLEIQFMGYLHVNGIKVPKIIYNLCNEPITQLNWNNNTWQVIALEFINGNHAIEYTHELIKDIARWQALMHSTSDAYKIPDNAPRLSVKLVESYFLPLIDISSINNVKIKQFLERAKTYRLKLNEYLPSGLCHLDYDKDNIISDNNKVKAILDFDDLAVAPFIVCLGYTIWHVWQYSGKEMAELYLKSYETIRPLDAHEKDVLSQVVLFRHYMISDLKIFNGHIDDSDARNYIDLENAIIKTSNW